MECRRNDRPEDGLKIQLALVRQPECKPMGRCDETIAQTMLEEDKRPLQASLEAATNRGGTTPPAALAAGALAPNNLSVSAHRTRPCSLTKGPEILRIVVPYGFLLEGSVRVYYKNLTPGLGIGLRSRFFMIIR